MASHDVSKSMTKKIRGKRLGTPIERGKKIRRRRPELQVRRSASALHAQSPPLTSRDASAARLRKDRMKKAGFSPLERLPVEILQHIFELSANIDLPITSHRLKVQLSKSGHLQRQLTSELLTPIFRCLGRSATTRDLHRALRLLNSRFMTWTFFRDWLHDYAKTLQHVNSNLDTAQLWAALRPAPGLVPPKKVLVGPFTMDKISLLSVFAQDVHDIVAADPVSAECAYAGLASAIEDNCVEAARILVGMGLKRDTEMLRSAVIDCGCHEAMVMLLLVGDVANNGEQVQLLSPQRLSISPVDFDLLDPALWSWAERARLGGDQRGNWLLDLLRDVQQQKIRMKSREEND